MPNQREKVALLYGDENMIDILQKADILREEDKLVSLIPQHKKLGKQLNRLKEQDFNYYCYWANDTWKLMVLE